MLSTLARIAKQLEADGHTDLADQADDIISALASRDSFPNYEPGGLWKEELDGAESNQDEELAEGGLEPHDNDELDGDEQTFSALLEDHKEAFRRFLAADDLIKEVARFGHTAMVRSAEGLIDALCDKLEYAIEYWSERKNTPIHLDDGFRDVAQQLIHEVLAAAAKPQA